MERDTKRVGRFEEWRTTGSADTLVVFVHGFDGSYRKTWASLPDFICADPRFDRTDIYLFGYRTGFLRFLDPDLGALGQRLRTVLLTELPRYRSVTLIAHSMGGLIVREMVASVLISGEAYKLRSINHIIFCSTPHLGSVGALLAFFWGKHLWSLRVLRPKILDNLKLWRSRVNAARSESDDIAHECYTFATRITNVWGLYDRVVSSGNASALPGTQELITIEGNHRTMVKPPSPTHHVYATLSSLIASGLMPVSTPDLPSQRVFNASQLLGVADLAISSTKELPQKYQALCGQFLSRH